jgi:hypothetical protein
MTDTSPAESPGDPAPLPPAVIASIEAALKMGIDTVEDIRDVLESAEGEELRQNRLHSAEVLLEGGRKMLELAQQIRATMENTRVRHLAAQHALLTRVEELAKTATAEQLTQLSAAYLDLPRPGEDD